MNAFAYYAVSTVSAVHTFSCKLDMQPIELFPRKHTTAKKRVTRSLQFTCTVPTICNFALSALGVFMHSWSDASTRLFVAILHFLLLGVKLRHHAAI